MPNPPGFCSSPYTRWQCEGYTSSHIICRLHQPGSTEAMTRWTFPPSWHLLQWQPLALATWRMAATTRNLAFYRSPEVSRSLQVRLKSGMIGMWPILWKNFLQKNTRWHQEKTWDFPSGLVDPTPAVIAPVRRGLRSRIWCQQGRWSCIKLHQDMEVS